MARRAVTVLLWVIRAPFVFGVWIYRTLLRLTGGWILATNDTLPCPGCSGEVPLQGFYLCEWCQAKFLGHAFAPCPTPGCGAIPAWIPCPRCEHSVYNPAFWGGRQS